MIWRMAISVQSRTVVACVALVFAVTFPLSAEKDNPYMVIAEHNAFGLTDPPPPPPPPAPKEQPKPASTIRLTGITTILSKARALFEIVEAPGKPPTKPILLVGEKSGDIELVAIDMEKKQATIRQGGMETNLVLEPRKAQAAAAPGQKFPPGVRPGPGFVPPMQAGMPGQPPAATPGVISPGVITPGSSTAGSSRSGVMVVGGSSSTPAAATPALPEGAPSAARAPYRIPLAGQGAGMQNATSLRAQPQVQTAIPPRTTRTQTTPQAGGDAAQQLIMLHLQEMQAAQQGQDFPPSPPMPQ